MALASKWSRDGQPAFELFRAPLVATFLSYAVTTRWRDSGRAMQPRASRHQRIKMVTSACDISVIVDV